MYLEGVFNHIGEKWEIWRDYGALIGGFFYMNEYSEIVSEIRPSRIACRTPIDLSLCHPSDYRLHQVSTFFSRSALDDVGRYVKENLEYVMDRELLFRVLDKYPIILDKKPLGLFRLQSNSKSVSKIIPFYREFSDLYISLKSGSTNDDKIRDEIAKYYTLRGYIKLAKAQNNFFIKVKIFFKCAFELPKIFLSYNIILKWLWIILKNHKRQF